MKNLVVRATQGRWKGRWVAGVNSAGKFFWLPCKDHDEAVRLATNLARKING